MEDAGPPAGWAKDHRAAARVSQMPPIGFKVEHASVGDFALTANVHFSTVPLNDQGQEDIEAIHRPGWEPSRWPDDPMDGHPLQEAQLLHFAEAIHALKPRPWVWRLMHELAHTIGLRVHVDPDQDPRYTKRAPADSSVSEPSWKTHASSNTTRFVTVHHRSNFASKDERRGVSP